MPLPESPGPSPESPALPTDFEPALRRMSTADVPPSQALDYYATSMQEALIPMSLHCPSRNHFHAAAESTSLGRQDLLRMVGSAHRVVRGPTELARSERRLFNLMLNRLAPWQLVQRGLTQLRAGDAIVVDSARPHELEVDAYEFINVAMTEDFVGQWLPDPSRLAARRLDHDGRWSAPLTRFVAQLTPEYMAWRCPLPDEVIANQLGALLMLAAGDLEPDERGPTPSELALRERIIDRLHERLAEIDLTASDVADSLGLEERALHLVLAANGETFAAVLLRLRIDAADRLGASSRGPRMYPDALARSAGFMDAKRLATARRNQSVTR